MARNERESKAPRPTEAALTFRRVLELLATYPDRKSLFAEYPSLEPEDLQQALRYAAAMPY